MELKCKIKVINAMIKTKSILKGTMNDIKRSDIITKSNWSKKGAGLPLEIPKRLLMKLPTASPNNAPKARINPKINPLGMLWKTFRVIIPPLIWVKLILKKPWIKNV